MERPRARYPHLLLPRLSCPLASGASSLVSRPVIYDTGMGLGEAALCLNIAPPLAINGRGSSELCGEKLALLTGASVWETLLPVVLSVQALLLWVSLSPFLRCGFWETTEHAAAAFVFPSSEQIATCRYS